MEGILKENSNYWGTNNSQRVPQPVTELRGLAGMVKQFKGQD
jgi:hypothetical protein